MHCSSSEPGCVANLVHPGQKHCSSGCQQLSFYELYTMALFVHCFVVVLFTVANAKAGNNNNDIRSLAEQYKQ